MQINKLTKLNSNQILPRFTTKLFTLYIVLKVCIMLKQLLTMKISI